MECLTVSRLARSAARRERAPTEWTARTKDPRCSISAGPPAPIRVMIRIEVTTYGESVISTPTWEISRQRAHAERHQ